MRRSPMARGNKPLRTKTALKAAAPLARKVGLAQVGRKRAAEAEAAGKPVKPALTTRPSPAVPADVRAALTLRSGGLCEMALPGCTRIATDVCHRISRKMGGRHGEAKQRLDRLSAIMHGCRQCHDWTGSRDAEAKEDGLRLDEWQIPAQEPVLYRGELSYLTDDGRVLSYEEAGA